MRIVATGRFNRIAKKLPSKVKLTLDEAVRAVSVAPEAGKMKVGDLAGVQVYKFKLKSQLYLLSYVVDLDRELITLLYLGTHENFYRDHKRG